MDARNLDADALALIGETMDRSWCAALIEALADPKLDFDQRRPLERALADLDDPRFVGPLLSILKDPSSSVEVCESILNVLSECGILAAWSCDATEQPDVATSWIRADNLHLQRLGFSLGNRADRQAIDEYISEVFDPPEPGENERITRMRAGLPAAVAAMAFGFEEPEYQARKVSLLDHSDPEVRAAAARTLLWDEPNIAEYPLIAATRDADPDVVVDALDVLQYYPTLAVRATLVKATRDAATLQQRQVADQSLANIDECLRRELGGTPHHPNYPPATQAWFAEAHRVLDLSEPFPSAESILPDIAPPGPADLVSQAPTSVPMNVQLESMVIDAAAALNRRTAAKSEEEWNPEMAAALHHPDGQWAAALRWLETLQPSNIPPTEKASFCTLLTQHQDPNVRYRGTRMLAGCDRADLLLELLDDRVGSVRKSASYALHDVSPSQEVAYAVLAPVLSGEIGGTRASESVRTWARHAFALDPVGAAQQALALTDDRRESVRHAAVKQIVAFDAPGKKTLLKFLRADPLVTWAVHSTVITSRHLIGISDRAALGALEQFLDTDNLWLQLALATLHTG
jgi:HEAT repeat protein